MLTLYLVMGSLLHSNIFFPMKIAVSELRFDSYKEYLKFTYKTAHETGRIVEVIQMVKTQPKHVPFDYEYCTVQGKM